MKTHPSLTASIPESVVQCQGMTSANLDRVLLTILLSLTTVVHVMAWILYYRSPLPSIWMGKYNLTPVQG